MAVGRLADELLKEIILPPLLVSDSMFADTSLVSPFSKATYSASNVLLVCKRWMRVGTPALYETVVVRSAAQAQALQLALANNPDFGRFIRRLRLEGTYGDYLTPKVFVLMTSVTDFCFTLDAHYKDKIAGISKALAIFNPRRVILTLNNKTNLGGQPWALYTKLCKVIPKWTRLEHFSTSRLDTVLNNNPKPNLAEELSKCTTLRYVEARVVAYGSGATVMAALRVLLGNVSIERIVVHAAPQHAPDVRERVKSSFSGQDHRICFLDSHGAPIALDAVSPRPGAAAMPFYTPMQNASRDTRVEIWRHIFKFVALKSPDDSDPEDGRGSICWRQGCWFSSTFIDIAACESLFRVCRDFYDALLPLLFRHVACRTASQYKAFMHMISSKPLLNLGADAITLSLDHPLAGTVQIDYTAFFDVFSSLVGVSLSSLDSPITDALPSLARACGRTLRTLELASSDYDSTISFEVFEDLAALEELRIDCEHTKFSASRSANTLQNLRHLHAASFHGSLFTALSKLRLPNIQHLHVAMGMRKADTFIKKHGSKLVYVAVPVGLNQTNMDALTSLITLEIIDTKKRVVFSMFANRSLQEIRISVASPFEYCRDALAEFSKARLPALRKIIIADEDDIWPASDRAIAKSSWPHIAEKFASHGVTVVDYTDRAWRPRLQVK